MELLSSCQFWRTAVSCKGKLDALFVFVAFTFVSLRCVAQNGFFFLALEEREKSMV